MDVLIIGGTGLISTGITQIALAQGHRVTHVNRGLRGHVAGVETVIADRSDHAGFVAAMRDLRTFDVVVDMIGFTAEDVQSDADAFAGRCGQFIFCSTVDVYQKPATKLPYTEDEPYGGLGSYAVNKVACEKLVRSAFPVWTIIRPAYTYGEGHGLLNPFDWSTRYLDRLLKGLPVVVHGDGSSLWTSCHRDDVARAFVAALGNPSTYGRSYHTTAEEWLTWDHVHQTVARAIGAPEPELIHIPTDLLVRMAPERSEWIQNNFRFNNVFDLTAAKRDLGFQQTISFEEGARRVFASLQGKIEDCATNGLEDEVIRRWHDAWAGL